jgi:hypothetical protein
MQVCQSVDLGPCPARRSVSWTGNSQASCGGHVSTSRDLDGSAASTRGTEPWLPPHAFAPAAHGKAVSMSDFPAPASLLPAGMLSPENMCPGGASFAPASCPGSTSSPPAPARKALSSLPVCAAHHLPHSPKLASHSQRSAQEHHAPRTAQHATPFSHGPALRRISQHSEQSCAAEDGAYPCGPSSHVDAASPHPPQRAPSCQSSQDSHAMPGAAQWLAHPEVQASILEMLDEELASAVDPNYMEAHSEAVMGEGLWVTPAMRLMTVNWMSEAVDDLELNQVRLPALCVAFHFRQQSADPPCAVPVTLACALCLSCRSARQARGSR